MAAPGACSRSNFETALKVGKPVARQALKNAKPFLASECPLAGMHIVQEMEMLADGQPVPHRVPASDRTGRPRLRHPGAWSDADARTHDKDIWPATGAG